MAEKIAVLCGADADAVSDEERGGHEGAYGEEFWSDMSSRFSPAEADELGRRFALMTECMRVDRARSDAHYTDLHRRLVAGNGEMRPPNFLTRALRTHYHLMPDIAIDELISSW